MVVRQIARKVTNGTIYRPAKKSEKQRKQGISRAEHVKALLATKDVEFHKQLFHKIGCLDVARIVFEVEAEGIGTDYVYSDYTSICGVRFRVGVKRAGYQQGFLYVYVFCNDNGAAATVLPVKTDVKLWIASPANPDTRIDHLHLSSHESYREFYSPASSHSGYTSWDCANDPTLGVVQNGRFTVRADIKVICCHKEECTADATAPTPVPKDVTLVVEGEKFPHNKKYLAHYSEYCKALFESGFAERNEAEIELKDIDAKEFRDLLDVIGPWVLRQPIRPSTVIGILRMADFFAVEFARLECTKFLRHSSAFSCAAKLALCEEFRLPELQYKLLAGLKIRNDFWRVINSKDFGSLSETLQTFLLQKYISTRR